MGRPRRTGRSRPTPTCGTWWGADTSSPQRATTTRLSWTCRGWNRPPPTGTDSRSAGALPRGPHPHASTAVVSSRSDWGPCAAPTIRRRRSGCTGRWPSARWTWVLHLGDYIYEDDGSGGARRRDRLASRPPWTTTRARLGQIRTDPNTQALHLRHPMVTIWDDHDLADNAWDTGAKSHDPVRTRAIRPIGPRPPPGPGREWLPARLRDPDDPLDHVAVHAHRRPRRAASPGHAPGRPRSPGGRRRVAGPGRPRSFPARRGAAGVAPRASAGHRAALGADGQRCGSWRRTGAAVARPLRWINGLLPNGYAVLDGRVLHDDQWDGYPAERRRVARWMADRCAAGGQRRDPVGRRALVLGIRRTHRSDRQPSRGGGDDHPGGVVGLDGAGALSRPLGASSTAP